MKIIIEVSDKLLHYATTLAELTFDDMPADKMKAITDSLKDDAVDNEVTIDTANLGSDKDIKNFAVGLLMMAICVRAEEQDKKEKEE